MWKPEHRLMADQRSRRYPSDLSNAEWALVAPMIPPARRGGPRRSVDVREVLNAIFCVLSTGCQWKAMPKDLPPKSTAHCYFMLWDWDGTLDCIHDALHVATREAAGREASPTVAISDSQSSKAAQKGALYSTRRALMREESYGPQALYSRRHTRPLARRERSCRRYSESRWRA